MTQRQSFLRKIGYFIAIAVLLLPMAMLSLPSSGQGTAEEHPGGKLAQLREEHKLAQASLGEIDPASETVKLVTLGMRGLAVNILWQKAHEYKMKEDWTGFRQVLDQIIKLQPNFIKVWEFQCWNVSYNLSVEFDDYRDRYRYVREGINLLKEGLQYNEDEPRLLWSLGWFIGQKIGRADERVQYRRLFKQDEQFHKNDIFSSEMPPSQRDNWLVASKWFRRAIDVVDQLGKRMIGKAPHIWTADWPKALINYADAIQGEGTHGEKAKLAWETAEQKWRQYGNRPVVHRTTGTRIRLTDLDARLDEVEQFTKQIYEISEGVEKQVHAKKMAELDATEREIINTPRQERTEAQQRIARDLERKLEVTPADLVQEAVKEHPEMAEQLNRLQRQRVLANREAAKIETYRDNVNYRYWAQRCRFEQDEDTLLGRELCYRADRALQQRGALLEARDLYLQAFHHWRAGFDRFKYVRNEGDVTDRAIDHVFAYCDILDQLDELDGKLPADFPLRYEVENYDREGQLRNISFADEQKDSSGPASSGLQPLPDVGAPPEPEILLEQTASVETTSVEASTSHPAEGAPPEPREQKTPRQVGAPPEPTGDR